MIYAFISAPVLAYFLDDTILFIASMVNGMVGMLLIDIYFNLDIKLSVIVKHYTENKYCIKYCKYRIFPLFYHYLYSYYHSIIGYNFTIGDYESMETYAKELTIEKIDKIKEKTFESYTQYKESQDEYKKKNIPYYQKKIK